MNYNRVLLLEDEPVIGRIIKRTLSADGFEVDVAENGLIDK
jgi:DNA-binding response OmpR family regulator